MVLIIALTCVLLLVTTVAVVCCLQKRRKQPPTPPASPPASNIEVQDALMDGKKPHSELYHQQRPIYRNNDNIKIVVNKMDDLLNHNTQNLQGSPHTCNKSGSVYNFFEENTYEVPHVLPANLRGGGSATGYYDSRDVIRPTYFTSVRS